MCEPAAKRSKCVDPEDTAVPSKADNLEYLSDVKVKVLHSNDDTTPITHIAHISDVHIRRNDRFEEYDHVFAQLYKGLRELKDRHPESIAVIAGDVVHSKCNMHSNGADAAWEFFKRLSDIMPVIAIPGNHDGQVHNAHAKNTLSTLLRDRIYKHPIHLLLHSGAYRYNNVVFGVSSIFDGKFVKAKSIIADLEGGDIVKIALYHGAVLQGTRISYGCIFPQGIGTQVFGGYDLALLGDIHKHQYLNSRQTMAYPGSLISQDFGETDDDHGWIEWDVALRKPTYYRVPNDYAHKSIDFIEGKVMFNGVECDAHSIIKLLPKKAHLRIMYKGDLVSVNRFEKSLLDSLPYLTVKKIPMLSASMVQCLPVLNVTRPGDLLNNPELLSFITSSYPSLTSEEVMETVKALVKEMSTLEDYVEFGESDWTPLVLRFSNLYSYGANNVINFTKLKVNGVVGLFAPNAFGKSSVLDILSIAMFGKTTSEGTLRSTVINETQKSFDTSLYFRTRGGIHCVVRKGTKSNMSQIRKLFHLVPKEQVPPSAAEEAPRTEKFMEEEYYVMDKSQGSKDTQKAVTKLVGSYDCFRLTSMCLQNGISDSSLIAMKNADRKLKLMNVFKLDVFETAHGAVKNKHKAAEDSVKRIEQKLKELGNHKKPLLDQCKEELAATIKKKESNEGIIKDRGGHVAVARASRRNVTFSEKGVKKKLADLDTTLSVLVTKMEEINKTLAAKNNEEAELQRKIDGLVLVGEKEVILEAHKQFELNKIAALEKLQRDEEVRRSEVRQLNEVSYDGSKHEDKLREFEKLEQQFKTVPTNLKDLKFSSDCDCCKHNRYMLGQMETGTVVEYRKVKEQLEKMERDKKLFEENQKITEHNLLIKERLHDIQRQREEINERKDERHELWKHQDNEQADLTARMLSVSKEQNKLISERHIMEVEMAEEKKTRDEFQQVLVDIDHNQKVDDMVAEGDKELARLYNEKEKLSKDHTDLIRKVATVEKDVELYNQQMQEYSKVSEEKAIYERLQHITNPRNGYSLHMLKQYIPQMCQGVNGIIGLYMDRNVDMKVEGETISLLSVPRDKESSGCPISSFSGMEWFMVDIAIKIVLGKMARVPHSSLMFIDEGMSVMDQDRMARIGNLFQFLRHHFRYSFVISHIDTVEEHVDMRLHITKEGRLSKIDNTGK